MKFSSTFNISLQRCLYPLFQNQRRHFLVLHLFRRTSQPVYPTIAEKMFQIHGVKITGKYICEYQRIASVHF